MKILRSTTLLLLVLVSREATSAPVPAPTPGGTAITRINAGGGQFVDAAGNTWIADNYFGGKGTSYGSCPAVVANTVDDELYCTNRWFAPSDGPPFVYQVPVSAAGLYEVRLHFAELVSLPLLFDLPMAVVVRRSFNSLKHCISTCWQLLELVFHNNWKKGV